MTTTTTGTPWSMARSGPLRLPAVSTVRSTVDRRRWLQLTLGLIWLADAALQYQPYMFGRAFVTGTIEPVAQGTPWIVEHPANWAAHVMIHHITVYNALFATIQLLIALAIFLRPTVRIGLAASIVWSLAVWWFAEGIGGVATGLSPVMGAPGAVILYAFIALLVWPNRRATVDPALGDRSVAERGILGPVVPKVAWAVMWVSFAYLGLESANRSPSALHDMIVGMGDGEPGWIKQLDRALAAPLAHHGTEWSIILAVLYVVVALAVFVPRTIRPGLAVAIVLGVAIWLAEDFGGVMTGSATDVNSGPLLVLFAVTMWPVSAVRHRSVLARATTTGEPGVQPVGQA